MGASPWPEHRSPGLIVAALWLAVAPIQAAQAASQAAEPITGPTAEPVTDPTASRPAPEPADLIIFNATVLTLNAAGDTVEDGALVVRDGRIEAVGGAGLLERYETETRLDAEGGIVMPGMINLHNHLPMVAFRGLGENGVPNRLVDFFFPLEKALLSRELIRTAARQAAIESALAGVTLVTDMYYHEDEVARSVSDVGIRGVLGESVIGFPVVDAPQPYGGLAYAERFIAEWKGHPLITPAVAPHAPYTVSPEWLLRARELAEREAVPLLMHVAEMVDEPDRIRAGIGHFPEDRTVIAYLAEIGFLSDRLVAAHVIHASDADIALLRRHGVGVAYNPKANGFGAHGFAPAWDMARAGLEMGLGTDGPMSSNQMDLINVMGFAAYAARNRGVADSTRFTPFDLVRMATLGGARALDREHELGSLEAGKWADVVIVDTAAPNMQPNYDPYATLAFAAYPRNVRTVLVAGRFVVRDRVPVQVDLDAHRREWRAVTERVAAFAEPL
ncbi:amidohydrolase family protein [Elongatibacter sediminis]|uniref:Amidohydrolase n=1 Tax=Elongatibacter sediminis TaxID=3119006 RepID=A0AAW9RFV5_9GAMM